MRLPRLQCSVYAVGGAFEFFEQWGDTRETARLGENRGGEKQKKLRKEKVMPNFKICKNTYSTANPYMPRDLLHVVACDE